MGHTDVAGDIKQLAPLVDLMTLNLRQTSASGNLLSLAPLHFVLSKLNLAATNVDGNVGQLFPHLQLEHLDLSITNVGGMIDGMQPSASKPIAHDLLLPNRSVKTREKNLRRPSNLVTCSFCHEPSSTNARSARWPSAARFHPCSSRRVVRSGQRLLWNVGILICFES